MRNDEKKLRKFQFKIKKEKEKEKEKDSFGIEEASCVIVELFD